MRNIAPEHDRRFFKQPSQAIVVESVVDPAELHVDLESEVGEELQLTFLLPDFLRMTADGVDVEDEVAQSLQTRVDVLVAVTEHNEDNGRFGSNASECAADSFDRLLPERIRALSFWRKSDRSDSRIGEYRHPAPITDRRKPIKDVDEIGVMGPEEIASATIANDQHGPVLQRLRVDELHLPQIPTGAVIDANLPTAVHNSRRREDPSGNNGHFRSDADSKLAQGGVGVLKAEMLEALVNDVVGVDAREVASVVDHGRCSVIRESAAEWLMGEDPADLCRKPNRLG